MKQIQYTVVTVKSNLLPLDSDCCARHSAIVRHVILTDEQGHDLGRGDLRLAHSGKGQLHKAFSVFVFRQNRSEILLQQRSAQKMLFPLLWTNACCSHPQEGEDLHEAAEKRLQEECGFTCPLKQIASFVYRAPDPAGRGTEYEYDTVFAGDLYPPYPTPIPDPREIHDIAWQPVTEIIRDLAQDPARYAPWFPLALHAILRDSHDQ